MLAEGSRRGTGIRISWVFSPDSAISCVTEGESLQLPQGSGFQLLSEGHGWHDLLNSFQFGKTHFTFTEPFLYARYLMKCFTYGFSLSVKPLRLFHR